MAHIVMREDIGFVPYQVNNDGTKTFDEKRKEKDILDKDKKEKEAKGPRKGKALEAKTSS